MKRRGLYKRDARRFPAILCMFYEDVDEDANLF
jgi:hypothetical protein